MCSCDKYDILYKIVKISMWNESCNIPDNTFNNLDIQLPRELTEWILDETKSELLDCFIESLNLQADSIIFLAYFKQTLREYGNMEFWKMVKFKSPAVSICKKYHVGKGVEPKQV